MGGGGDPSGKVRAEGPGALRRLAALSEGSRGTEADSEGEISKMPTAIFPAAFPDLGKVWPINETKQPQVPDEISELPTDPSQISHLL